MTISNGNLANANEVLDITKIAQLYQSTAFNSSQSGAGDNEGSYEMTAISASSLVNANYLVITITGTHVTSPKNGTIYDHVYTQLKVQTKEIGGAYSDSTAYQNVLYDYDDSGSSSKQVTPTWVWVHTLTAGEKANGVQVKLFSNSHVDNNGTGSVGLSASFTNKQAILEIKS